MDIKDKNTLAIGLGLTLVTVSNIIGHFAGPFSILATPILLTIIIAGINSHLYKSNFILTIVYNFGLLLLNDLLIRLYAGGTHDQVGKALISLFFIVAFVLALITMAIYCFISFDEKSRTKKILTNLFIIVILASTTGLIYASALSNL